MINTHLIKLLIVISLISPTFSIDVKAEEVVPQSTTSKVGLEQMQTQLDEAKAKVVDMASRQEDMATLLAKISDLSKEVESYKLQITQLSDSVSSKSVDIKNCQIISESKFQDMSSRIQSLSDEINLLRKTVVNKEAENTHLNILLTKPQDIAFGGVINVVNKQTVVGSNSSIVPVAHVSVQSELQTNTQPVNIYSVKCTDAIVNQSKQLTKSYEEINNLKASISFSNKIFTNFSLLAQDFTKEGKLQDAARIYQILSQAEVKDPAVYSELSRIYKTLGMVNESNREYNKLYTLFPNIKGNEKASN